MPENREKQLALVRGDDRLVVANEFCKQRHDEHDGKYPEGIVAAPIALEIVEPALVERPQFQETRAGQCRHEIFPRGCRHLVAQNRRAHLLDLARLEIDPRIDPRIGEVGKEIHEKTEQRKYEQIGKDDGVVAIDDRLEREQAQSVERKNGLDQKRTGEEGTYERTRKARHDDQHGIAENVAIENLAPAQSLHPCGQDVLLFDLLKKRILGEKGGGCESTESHRDNWQGDMPEVIPHFVDKRELVEIFRRQPTQRENLPERTAGKKHDQENREQKARYGVADYDDGRTPDVEARSIVDRLGDPERDRDRVGKQRHP